MLSIVARSDRNLGLSLLAKINNDLNFSWNTFLQVTVIKQSSLITNIELVPQFYSSSATYPLTGYKIQFALRHGTANDGTPIRYLSPAVITRHPAGFVSKAGDTSIKGALGYASNANISVAVGETDIICSNKFIGKWTDEHLADLKQGHITWLVGQS